MNDVFIHRVSLPPKVKGLVVKRDDDYIVFINEALSDAEQQKAVRHELQHIMHVHLEQDLMCARECEDRVNFLQEEL